MRRTGSRLVLCAALFASAVAGAQDGVEFSQSVDHEELGLQDTLRLTISATNAPDDGQIKLPASDDFELLSRAQSSEMSYQAGGGGPGQIRRTTRWTLVLRPLRKGTLTLPPSLLVAGGQTYRTEPLRITVKEGRLLAQRRPGSAWPGLPPVSPDDPNEDEAPADDVTIPRTSSDLFLRSQVDKKDVYVGEQVTLTVNIYSRVDLSGVDTMTMPKLDGFWSEEVDSPNRLIGAQRLVDGVPYRVYLIKRYALFPVRAGKLKLDPVEADVTTGFLFANRRVTRRGNAVELNVNPLPAGAPTGFSAGNVGQWELSTEVEQTEVELGQPITVRVVLEGKGSLRSLSMPQLRTPPQLRAYDPTTTDRPTSSGSQLGGRRVQEYLVMPQQSGTFTLPALSFPYFDPETERYDVSRTEPITVTVRPGASAPVASGDRGALAPEPSAKNVLAAGGLKPLRHRATFSSARPPLWRRPSFVALVCAPVALLLLVLGGEAVRQRVTREDPRTQRDRQIRAARARLAAAQKLETTGDAGAFYGEVEKAVLRFLEAKLGIPVAGLTRDGLAQELAGRGVDAERTQRIVAVLDQCDAGRFSPGGAGERSRVLSDAEVAMGGWK